MSKKTSLKNKNTKSLIHKIKKDIDVSISKISSLPKIEIENFSSKRLKDKLIPMLEEAKDRVVNIEEISKNFLTIREEFIGPVNETIQKNSKFSNYFSICGIIIGLIGLYLTIQSDFNFIPVLKKNILTYQNSENVPIINNDSQSKSEIKNNPLPSNTDNPEDITTFQSKTKLTENLVPGSGYVNKEQVSFYKPSNTTENNIIYLIMVLTIIIGMIYKPRFPNSLFVSYSKDSFPRSVTTLNTNFFMKWLLPFYPESKYIGNIRFVAMRKNKISFSIKDKDINKIFIDGIEQVEPIKKLRLSLGSELKIDKTSCSLKYDVISI